MRGRTSVCLKVLRGLLLLCISTGNVSGQIAETGCRPALFTVSDRLPGTDAAEQALKRPSELRKTPPDKGRYHGRNIFKIVVDWVRHTNDSVPPSKSTFSIIGAPYYASDVQFAATVLGSASYHTAPGKAHVQPSFAALRASISTTLFYSFGIDGINNFPSGRTRLNYFIRYRSLPTYFWGIGFENGIQDRKSDFRENSVCVNAVILQRIFSEVYVGPAIEYDFFEAQNIQGNKWLWDGLPEHIGTAGIGLVAEYDTRDYITQPERGFYIRFNQKFYPRFLKNGKYSFSQNEITANIYRKVWQGGILAGQIHGNFTYRNTPWTLMPTFGENTVRGYYCGRYRDKCEADMTLELRQHVWKRSGAVVWVGAASVFPTIAAFRVKHILPNFGIGYRFEFKRKMNIRVDLGFGRKTWAFAFNINECF